MNFRTFFRPKFFRHRLPMLVMGLVLGVAVIAETAHAELDAMTALEVLKRNNCTKCHSIKKSKNGPSYNKVARKRRGDPEAAAKLFTHLTTTPVVKLEDGTEEEHKKTDFRDPEELREFIRWILSL